MAEFNNLLMDIGQKSLPTVNGVLRDLKDILKTIRGEKHSVAVDSKWGVGTTALEGAGIGAGVGALMGGVGVFRAPRSAR